jgi:hypothetical protein
MTTQQHILDFYTHPTGMTSAGDYAPMLELLPRNPAALTQVVQGLLLHEHLAAYAYGIELSHERRAETHIRSVEQMLDRLSAREDHLAAALPVGKRLVGTCRNFTVLLVAMLRSQGIPARARSGFGDYFNPGFFEDHWVGEYWSAAEARWLRVDAQIDAVQREMFKIDFDLLDVPHDRFVAAGDAWAQCRDGKADPAKFGMSLINEGGLWFIAGNIVRDAAALNNMELLPWDVWGAMPGPEEPLSDDQLAFFDQLAALTCDPDGSSTELRALYESDERLRVPATVFNAVLSRPEMI